MTTPSTNWQEVVAPDEAQRHRDQADLFVEMQRRKSAKFGTGRALHRKQRPALRATLEVPADLPAEARQGIFATEARYEVQVRLSNGGFDRAPDHVPDIRGFAFKVLGVDGRSVFGGPAASQDFVLINHEKFSSSTSREFSQVTTAGGAGLAGILRALLRSPRLFGNLKEVRAALNKPFSGFATEDFFSAAPISYGPYAVRVRLRAASAEVNPQAKDDWSADIYSRLAQAPLVHELQVQFFLDEARTPIEDAAAIWDSPYQTVARLVIGPQEPDEAFAAEVEAAKFDPWNAVAEHRPLGEVMRARKVAYRPSQLGRGAG
ncbi:hypothetical protein ABZX92_27295 [Lentzea sp. NPDC006480]|uniref:hypothetical protein n=1 Tax=Lentzea sp. NPDC006480 TaxID=3157176 RepID=UPI0033A6B8D1